MRMKQLVAAAGIGILTATIGIPTTAIAQDSSGGEIEAMETVSAIVPEVLADTATVTTTTSDAITYSSGEGETAIEVPLSPQADSTIVFGDVEVGISLPFSDTAQEAEIIDGGMAVIDNGNSSSTVPIAQEDGALQILTIIDGPEAPTRYEYELTLDGGGTAVMREDGAIFLTDGIGDFSGVIAPAWAKDANGNALPTWYEIQGTSVTQVIEHGSTTAYPVVADPWLGIQLFTGFRKGSWNGKPTYNASVTGSGAIVLGGGGFGVLNYAAGQAIFRSAGFDEWASRWNDMRVYGTLRSQFDCHVAAGVAGLPFTGEYNLELARPDRYPWPSGVGQHHCNW